MGAAFDKISLLAKRTATKVPFEMTYVVVGRTHDFSGKAQSHAKRVIRKVVDGCAVIQELADSERHRAVIQELADSERHRGGYLDTVPSPATRGARCVVI